MARIKGVFFTFGGFFLVMLVFVLALLVATTIHHANDRLRESGSLERLYILDHSIEKVIRDLEVVDNVSIVWSDDENLTTITISENLYEDFSDYKTDLETDFNELSSFVTADQPEITFNANKLFNATNRLTLLVKPNDLIYTHINEGGETVLMISQGTFVPVKSFIIHLRDSNLVGGSEIDWITKHSGEELLLNITVIDQNGNSYSSSDYINDSLSNEVLINNQIPLTVSDGCVGCIKIDRNSQNITTTFIGKLIFLGDMSTLNLPENTYSINFSNLGVYLNKSPRIL